MIFRLGVWFLSWLNATFKNISDMIPEITNWGQEWTNVQNEINLDLNEN